MKHIFRIAILIFGINTANVASAAGASIAVIDMQVINNAKVSQHIHEQLKQKNAAFRAEISQKEEKLKKESQALNSTSATLSKQELDKKHNEFRKKVVELQRQVQLRKSQLDKAYMKAISEVQKVVVEIVAKIAEEEGFDIVIAASDVLYNKPSINISKEVVKRLDEKLVKLPLVIEEANKDASKKH